ncbi:molybdate transport system ATP-binding protein [Cryobacterium psychrophilum]|uniref:ABC transporter ATP-binding protein n=2 Tax=Cryobacterium psychrophilum TaxID=41988 RepID=A0A4Y8KKI1_9MICO|nr:ABC transporter ATP-binding protein [Cryobacterium psychrophilum]TDW30544.1 molybdate transport system ATP-binding protein [Cryobacterium psychrophilum]TFD76292.1 ABC transporter ATP-binding protein [Cryobacterium psychrophilum]
MLHLSARMPERGLDVRLHVERGETVAILGPNGAGKSTLLGVLAGLVRPETGRAALAGRALFRLGSESADDQHGHASREFAAPGGSRTGRPQDTWLPPHARGVALLAQDALLFPHLSSAANVAFGPRSAGATRREAQARALHWLGEVDATDLAARRPARLSGGQAQRVAVARALAAEPQLLLLDEPLAALDVAAAPVLRRMLRRVLADQTVLIVTHDVLDALTLADRVVVMHEGRIIEQGPTRDVLERPRTRFTADLAALNLITGTNTHAGVVMDADATVILPCPSGAPADMPAGSRVGVAVRPANVLVSLTEPRGPNLTVLPALVRDLEPRGDVVRVRSDGLFADLTPRVIADLDLGPGIRAYFSFAAVDAVTYPL